MSTALMVFTRDLRVRDNPALAAACSTADTVVPLFVHDDALPIGSSANRARFLDGSLRDLDASLRARGGRLVVRRGDWVETVVRAASELSITDLHLAADVSAYAQRRARRLRHEASGRFAVHFHDGVTVVAPGLLTPAGGGEFKVFTPYYRRWLDTPWRTPVASPARIVLPDAVATDLVGWAGVDGVDGAGGRRPGCSPADAGESAGLRHLKEWAAGQLADYSARHDDLAAAATSKISPYLHFGCLSPCEVASLLIDRRGGGAFVRQLCWRDFYHQVLQARPEASTSDYRTRHDRWNDDPEAFEAWRSGHTGYPLVDAAMRQLAAEGFMHNRARMVVASFLTKDLYLDWRVGAAHFMDLLVDGDVANNQLNWQWTAGTGTDRNPHRIFNPVTQSRRFDPDGVYIRRYLPELASVAAPEVHWPDDHTRRRCGYPAPIVDHGEAIAAYRVATSAGSLADR